MLLKSLHWDEKHCSLFCQQLCHFLIPLSRDSSPAGCSKSKTICLNFMHVQHAVKECVCESLCSSFAWFIKSQTGFHSRGRSKEVRVQMYFSVCFTLQTWLCPVAFTRLDSTLETRHFKSNGFNATSHSTPTRHLETFCSFPLQTLLNGAYTEDAPWCQFLWLPWRLDLKSVALRGQNKMEPTHCCNIIYRWPCDQAQLRQLLHHIKPGHWICICSCILTDVIHELREKCS